MSLQSHREAIDTFMELREMDAAERLDALADEDSSYYRIPCSAGLTGYVFRELGIEQDEWDLYWTKLYGRPVARVYRLYEAALAMKPEQINGILTAFAKKVKPVGGAS